MAADSQRVPIEAQSVDAPLSSAAVFLVVTVRDDDTALATARDTLGSINDLVKDVGFRDLDAHLSCIVGIGSDLWERLGHPTKPRELRPFTAIAGPAHTAPATPGDLLFHIRSARPDLCFELERLVLQTLGDSVDVVDEVSGFRYFDARDLLGFVDGTANPTGGDLYAAAYVPADGPDGDPEFAHGSYVVVQRYLHDLDAWAKLSTEEQQAIVGRTKLDNVEIDDDADRQKSHKTLATITDADGNELDILRDNMPFGRPGQGEFGTYFIGYSGRLWVIERMLQRMFCGEPAGLYDRILDVSTAHTGTTFFVPTEALLEELAGD